VRRRTCWMYVLTLLVATATLAQENKLKVYISADMEGVGGVSTLEVQAEPRGREYEKFCRIMTEEVNAAISGAYDAGATEVLVSDSHGDGQNIDIELLDRRARLIRAWPRPLAMMQGIDKTFGAVVFIGYHAGEGQADAVIPHDFSHNQILKLNGVEVSEAGFNGAIAGDFDVPVVFLSGDQTITRQAREVFGPIETVAVKQAIGYSSAIMMHPEESQRLIRAGVKRGVERRGEMKPYKMVRPIKLEITFFNIVKAEVVSYLPGVERTSGETVVFIAHDMVEANKFLWVANSVR
jgi:D-amino peptidase